MAGNLDAHFGVGGIRTEQYAYSVSTEELTSEAVSDKQGRVVFAATTLNGHGSSAMLVRFNPDGSYDATFGNAGKSFSPMFSDTDRVVDIDLQSNGKIIVLSQVRAKDQNSTASFSLMRFMPNGELDMTFGERGRIRHQYTPPFQVNAKAMAVSSLDDQIDQISVSANGDILGTGFRQTSDQTQAVFLRLLGADSAWQNPSQIHDVDDNKSIDPLDVLNLINYINLNGSGSLPGTRPSNSLYGYVDVDGDMQVSPLDVLRVINMINASGNGEGEATKEGSQRQEGQVSDFWNTRLESIELSDILQLKKNQNRGYLLLSKRQYQ